ncbi:hypothetical protein P153DRAFT_370461 [Dothidotthia symphoricarpi CBS 119687]|uniref:Extracellular mutant protein 11 C-terminal domain-containing protein n=1 Tax=Dothidotthia symphoricarpi CBS 119687 TaxID=1392245 RepID=A0A6A6A1U0_9PLEO|nr:uncharacterized protein P153DRAFT_370461 [Dothidotthia symphoricarpi CBS 119687]KAF2125143.1 hypothetical protein P153DRAFT_370461 [Dothidotthia symphoricarpi CBS 119687]
MHGFVKDRGINTTRQVAAANAKILIKKSALTQQPQVQSDIPARGSGNAQNTSVALQQFSQQYSLQNPQQNLQRLQSGQGQKRDAYDTDAESLDTTVNHSVVQVEDSQYGQPQLQQHGHIVDLGSEDVKEQSSEDVDEDDDEEGEYDAQYQISTEGVQLLEQKGYQGYTHEEQMDYLYQNHRGLLRTIDGDSYPTTTDGNPNEEGGHEPWDDYDDNLLVSPSPQRPSINGPTMQVSSPQPVQQAPNASGFGQAMQKPSKVLQFSATLRDQQRSNTILPQRGGHVHQGNPTPPPTSQPPTHSQTALALPVHSTARQIKHAQADQLVHPVPQHIFGSGRVQSQPHAVDLFSHVKYPSSARSKTNPPVQQQQVEQASAEELHADPFDYDREALLGMTYEQLKNESFDEDPRAKASILSDDMLQKSLVDRLEFVQENFDAEKQSTFFHSVRSTEWEEAGDWFIGKFSEILNRTKEARQTKRKLARDFEQEVEKRHLHVAKKQHQVEEAMKKMKTQGEGLVRSPRPSRSPRPKRG